jgi:hypothetical protein
VGIPPYTFFTACRVSAAADFSTASFRCGSRAQTVFIEGAPMEFLETLTRTLSSDKNSLSVRKVPKGATRSQPLN